MFSPGMPMSRRRAVQVASSGVLGAGLLDKLHANAAYQATPNIPASGEISVWYHPFADGIEAIYADFKGRFEQENPGTTVNLELIPFADRYPKILSAIAANEAPDVISLTIDALIRFVDADALVALDDLVPAEIWAGYTEATASDVTYLDQRWCMPIEQEVSVWAYNKTILADAGLDPEKPPYTWTDITAMCEAVKGMGDDLVTGWGYPAAADSLNASFYPFLYQAGGRAFNEDGSPAFNSAAGVEALNYIVELFAQGYVSQEYFSPITNNSESPFFQNRQALNTRTTPQVITDLRSGAPDIDFGITPVLMHTEQWGFGGHRSWAITRTSANPSTAAAFIAFLARDDNMLIAAEAIGRFPTKPAVAEQAYPDDPMLQSLRASLEQTFGEQRHKFGRDIMPIVLPEIQAAILGEKTSQEALDTAAEAVNELISGG